MFELRLVWLKKVEEFTVPAKGETYNKVDIDLRKWCSDNLEATGRKPADLARVLGVVRARITDMMNGIVNTTKYVEIVVNNAERGNWETMIKYATSEDGVRYLKQMQMRKKLTPYEKTLLDNASDILYRKIEDGETNEIEEWLKVNQKKKRRGRPAKK